MRTVFPASKAPRGRITLVITGYNWQDINGKTREPVKRCACCKRILPLVEFISYQELRTIKGRTYLVYTDRNEYLCREQCSPEDTDFRLHFIGNRIAVRVELHYADGAPCVFIDPRTKEGRHITERSVRLMDKKLPAYSCVLRMEPREDRAHSEDGKPYKRSKGK